MISSTRDKDLSLMTGEEETQGLLGSRPVSARSEDDAPYEDTAVVTESDADSQPLWGKCIVLTLDIFNSLSLLLGGVLLAIYIYLKEEWDKGISGEEIVSHFFLKLDCCYAWLRLLDTCLFDLRINLALQVPSQETMMSIDGIGKDWRNTFEVLSQ